MGDRPPWCSCTRTSPLGPDFHSDTCRQATADRDRLRDALRELVEAFTPIGEGGPPTLDEVFARRDAALDRARALLVEVDRE